MYIHASYICREEEAHHHHHQKQPIRILKCMNVSTCQIMRGGVEKAKKRNKTKEKKRKKTSGLD